MLTFMEAMSNPDGGVSFFNDSVDGISPKKTIIESYAEKLGFEISLLDLNKSQIIDNAESGYICATAAGSKLIFDSSPVGPDYIPAHAHADTLSFELSIGVQRVFVNSGTSVYGSSSERLNQRKTASHNTVEIDGKDSSQVWSGFRVARRAKIVSRYAEKNSDNEIFLGAAHDGYNFLVGGCIHKRNLTLTSNSLQVSDELKGNFKQAIARFYIHPNLDVSLNNKVLKIQGLKFSLSANIEDMLVSMRDSFWYPQFGQKIPNKVIEINFACKESKILFTWEESFNQ